DQFLRARRRFDAMCEILHARPGGDAAVIPQRDALVARGRGSRGDGADAEVELRGEAIDLAIEAHGPSIQERAPQRALLGAGRPRRARTAARSPAPSPPPRRRASRPCRCRSARSAMARRIPAAPRWPAPPPRRWRGAKAGAAPPAAPPARPARSIARRARRR